jgi:Tfp pilus assembly protein FimT
MGGKVMKKIRNDNSGLSFVEIIITVAILSVLVGVLSYGLSFSNGKPAEECARKIASTLSHARTSTMGKYRNVVTLKDTGSGIVMNEHTIVKLSDTDGVSEIEGGSIDRQSSVGAKRVKVEYSVDGGGSWSDIGSSGLKIRFDSGSGSLKEPAVTGGSLMIRASKAGTVKTVTITEFTGNIEVS